MPYTPLIAPADLHSVAYPEVIDEITRSDGGALAIEAIDTAIQEAKAYLSAYDLVQLFGSPTANTPPTFTDAFLTRLVKNIAMWQLLQLANPNINYEDAKVRYEQAVKTLEKIQKGTMQPAGWPYIDTTNETFPQGDSVSASSNPKRFNSF